jgi:hypothetical protein
VEELCSSYKIITKRRQPSLAAAKIPNISGSFLNLFLADGRLRSPASRLLIRGRNGDEEGTMPRRAKGVTAAQVEKGTKPGRYGDGAGLYLLGALEEGQVLAVPLYAQARRQDA